MNYCHGAAGLDLLDNENGAARDGAAEELPVGGDGVGLVPGSEIFSCGAQEDCGNVAAIGNWRKNGVNESQSQACLSCLVYTSI